MPSAAAPALRRAWTRPRPPRPARARPRCRLRTRTWPCRLRRSRVLAGPPRWRGTPAAASGSPTRCRAARAAAPARRPRRSACRRSRSRAVPSGPPARASRRRRGRRRSRRAAAGRRADPRACWSNGYTAVWPSRAPGSAARRITPTTSSSLLSSGAAFDELRRLGPERRARHVVEEVGMGDLHRLGELAELALERRRRPRVVAAGAACEKKGEHDDAAHPLRVNAAPADMSSLTCRG